MCIDLCRLIRTHADNVPSDGVSKGEITGDGYKDVDEGSDSSACHHNTGCPEVGVVADFVEYRKHLVELSADMKLSQKMYVMSSWTYILVASVREDNDRKAAERGYSALPPDHSDYASILHRISFNKVRNDKNDQITDRDQGDHACIFQGVKPP